LKPDYLIYGAPAVGYEELDEVIACVRSGWLETEPRAQYSEKSIAV
jgi:hypothetical protein